MAMDKEREALMRVCQGMIDIVERVGCKDWRDQHGRRLKDTKEWVEFYVTVKRAAEQVNAEVPKPLMQCSCGEPWTLNVVHRNPEPCFYWQAAPASDTSAPTPQPDGVVVPRDQLEYIANNLPDSYPASAILARVRDLLAAAKEPR